MNGQPSSRFIRASGVALLVTVAAACGGGLSGPDGVASFSASPFSGGIDSLPRPEAAGLEGAIRFTGGFATPCLAQPSQLSARAEKSGDRITLTVGWERPDGACATAIGLFRYEARVEGLPAGEYRVRVLHDGSADVGFPDPPLRATVRVR